MADVRVSYRYSALPGDMLLCSATSSTAQEVTLHKALPMLLMLATASLLKAGQAPPTNPLKNVKVIQVLSTVISNPKKVKDPDAAAIIEKTLRRAILANEFQVADSAPVKVRISLGEFTGGSQATRFIIGYGAGRSTVDCRIQILDQDEKEIASVPVHVRGDLAWGAYQGNMTQTKQAVNKFELTLIDEIEKWK
jgi:hypothetical protein